MILEVPYNLSHTMILLTILLMIFRSISLTSVPGKIMEQILLESLLKQMEGREVTGENQHRFNQGQILLDQHGGLL